jgi:hypothetical protein
MNRGPILATVVLSVLSSGCGTFFGIAARNIVHAPLDAASNCSRHVRLCHQAHDAFRDLCRTHPEQEFSADYAHGFEKGFIHDAEGGGNGEPPPNPPPCYQHARFDNPAGRQALEDYYAGFRHGAAVARESGVRDFIVVPPGQAPAPATDPDQRLRTNQPFPAPSEPLLPPPQPVPVLPTAARSGTGLRL